MSTELKGLLSGDELKAEYAKRSLDHNERVVTAKSEDLLKSKIALEAQEAWALKKLLKRKAILKRPKATDIWLEDRIWSLLQRFGFTEMNKDRQFMVVEAGGTKRQVDIFAKDDETVFVVECTHMQKAGNRPMKQLIDKINSYRADIIKAVHSHYGSDPKLKVKFSIATLNIVWNGEDKKRAEAANIAVITESDVEYYEGLYSILKDAARYQFLGRYLRGERVEGLQIEVPATKGKAGDSTFYTFLLSPHDLLKIGYVNHRVNNSRDDLDTYQRLVKPSRLKQIGEFLNDGGKFPTNIVVNFKAPDGLEFHQRERFGDTVFGTLKLPGLYGCAWIIDGQHRLYGYAYARRKAKEDHSVVSVLAYDRLRLKDEIEMFVDINTKQQKIRPGLVVEIVSNLNFEDKDPSLRLEALYANIPMRLERLATSPLHKRVNITGTEKSCFCNITTKSIADQAEADNLLGRVLRAGRGRPAELDAGPLAAPSNDSADILDKSVETLSTYFDLFASRLEDHWKLGDAPGGYLCTNNGLRPLMRLLARLLHFLREKEDVRALYLSPKEIIDHVKPYVEPLISFFETADPAAISAFRNRGSSLKTVDENCFQMMAIISEAVPRFTTKELEDYKSRRDIEGTRDAKRLIEDINAMVFEDVLATLREKYGEDDRDWWMKGVPLPVRNRCDQMFNRTGGQGERWRQLSMSDYPEILLLSANWDVFKDFYNFHGRGTRTAAVAWIGGINKAKAVTDNAERGPLAKEDVAFVRRVHQLVKRFIEGDDKVDGKTSYLTEDDTTRALADVA